VGKPLLYPDDPQVVALATDQPASFAGIPVPVHSLNDLDALATLVVARALPSVRVV
jgi:molybdopterin-guanine dinucleotide biosynthesis protein B